jgi:hypothetical protein
MLAINTYFEAIGTVILQRPDSQRRIRQPALDDAGFTCRVRIVAAMTASETSQPGRERTIRLSLPQVTLCAVTSVNLRATLRALAVSLDEVDFADCLLFTDAPIASPLPEIRIIPVPRIDSTDSYSAFVLLELARYVTTSHCLVVQWDGHVLDAQRWRPEFLQYDYIGARWTGFDDGHDVGNGGFSLRSRRLMEACLEPGFNPSHPEDLAIARHNRAWLEQQGMQFAPPALADAFSAERASDPRTTFGYHGVWNMPRTIGLESFWDVYRDLDHRRTVLDDFDAILDDVRRGPSGAWRATRMRWDRYRSRNR